MVNRVFSGDNDCLKRWLRQRGTAIFIVLYSYLTNESQPPLRERLQSPEDRITLDGLFERILGACCLTACPSFWWNHGKFVGQAGLLTDDRFIADSRDDATNTRLDDLEDWYRLIRCRNSTSCIEVFPKGLNPAKAIGEMKEIMIRRAI